MFKDAIYEGKNSSSTDCTFNPANRPECYKTMGLREVSGVKGLEGNRPRSPILR